MLKLKTPLMLQLADGQLLCWNQAVAVTLRVTAGRVWVTCPGDPDDHFVDAGGALPLAPRSAVLIGAEGAAQIAIEAERAAWRVAWRRWFQRASSARAWPASIAAAPATGAVSSMT
ncbi:MAG: DUF2917 domain-containing protein [Piscinibacter sp.]